MKGLLTFRPEPEQQARRIVRMQLHVVLPAKVGIILVILWYVFTSAWTQEAPNTHDVALNFFRAYFLIYSACNLCVGAIFVKWRRFPPGLFQWLVFTLGLLDGLFVSGLVVITDGFPSIAYWLFPVLIVLNALSIPLATPQIVLNMLLGFLYLSAGLVFPKVPMRVVQDTPSGIFQHNRPATNAVVQGRQTNQLAGTNFLRTQFNERACRRSQHQPRKTNKHHLDSPGFAV